MERKNDKKSLCMLILAMLIFGTIGIFRRWIPLSSSLLAFARGVQGTLFLILFISLKKKKIFRDIEKRKLYLLILSGALIGINWMLLFEAYNATSVPTATLCYYMEPTIVILLSPFLLKEQLTGKKVICSILAIIGMIFVSGVLEGQKTGADDMKGILFGLGAAALYATVVIINKKLGKIDAYQQTIIQLGAASITILPYLILTEDFTRISWNGRTLLMLLIVGIVHTGIAYALYFGSMEGIKGQSIAIFSYIDPISALVLAAIFLGESLSIFGVVGAIMILGATLFSEL